MSHSATAVQGTPAPQAAPIVISLTPDQVELVLVALYVLDEAFQHSELPIEQQIPAAMQHFEIHDLKTIGLGQLIDDLWNPLYEVKFPMTAAERLMAIDAEGLSDEEAFAIIRDIEATHGKIDFEGYDHAHR